MSKVFDKDKWEERIVVLIMSGLFASVGNWISTMRAANTAISSGAAKVPAVYMPWDVLPGLAIMFVLVVLGCMIDDILRAYTKLKLPTILYISLLAILVGIPGFSPIASYFVAEVNKIGLLPLCTPILAFAGISLGKDIDGFRKQGIGIIMVALTTIIGIYVFGVLSSQFFLMLFGQL